MDKPTTSKTAAMAGGGLYNRHSGVQHANLQSALPLLEEAAREVGAARAGLATVADYGASQGRNSMGPMSRAIDLLRLHEADRPVQVVHTDLPSNDFTSLFTLLADDPASYLVGRTAVFPSAVGRSYFEVILPPRSVDLGWSSNALHWMTQSPVEVDDHAWAVFSGSQAARDAVDGVLEQDWREFLAARSVELRPGGRLICQFMGRGEDHHGFEWMAGNFWQSIVALKEKGSLSEAETRRMTAPSAGRSLDQVSAPFRSGEVHHLEIDHLSLFESPDPFWDEYQKTGNARLLGEQWSRMMRAANGPNFAGGLDASRDKEALLDELTEILADRIAADPQRSRSWNVLLSIRKTA
jgi:cyclopropane-fatty-acyl-phospholipid synthase